MRLINYILSGVLIATTAPALEIEDPAQFCKEANCTPKMRKISRKFAAGRNDFINNSIVGFSGTCFHIHPDYHSNHSHHGAFVFENENDQLLGNGVFSFFSTQDPYENMNSIELRELLTQSSPLTVITVTEKNVELAYASEQSDIRYYFRTSEDFKELYVIGRNSNVQYISMVFCSMQHR